MREELIALSHCSASTVHVQVNENVLSISDMLPTHPAASIVMVFIFSILENLQKCEFMRY